MVANAWNEHVRDFARRNNVTYGCALSMPECRQEYAEKKKSMPPKEKKPKGRPKKSETTATQRGTISSLVSKPNDSSKYDFLDEEDDLLDDERDERMYVKPKLTRLKRKGGMFMEMGDNRSNKEKKEDAKSMQKMVKKAFGKGVRKNVNLAIGDVGKTAKQLAKKIKKGFDKEIVESGIGKEIAKELIDVGSDVVLPAGLTALSMALGDPTGLSGSVTGKVIGDQIQKQAEKKGYGYGVSRKKLTELKNQMTSLLEQMMLSEEANDENVKEYSKGLITQAELRKKLQKKARQLTNKVFKLGESVLDKQDVKMRGGKISLSKVKKDLINSAKKIWKEAKPILKSVGETALAYGEPLIEEGLKSVAMSYGVPPETADLSSKIFTGSVKAKAQEKLNKFSKTSQTPEEALDKVSALVQKRADKYIAEAERRGMEQINRMPIELQEQARQSLLSNTQHAKNVLDSNVEAVETKLQDALPSKYAPKRVGGRLIHLKNGLKVNPTDRLVKTYGMGCACQENMGTLLQDDLKQDFIPQANLPQGLISGGSFRIQGGSFRL